MVRMPEVDCELCDNCGLCVAACHGSAIVCSADGLCMLETENCDYCGVCEAVCPQGAIKCSYTVVPKEDNQ